MSRINYCFFAAMILLLSSLSFSDGWLQELSNYIAGFLFVVTAFGLFSQSQSPWGFVGYLLAYAFVGIGVMGGWLFVGWILTFFEPRLIYWGMEAVERNSVFYPILCMMVGGIVSLFLWEDARLAAKEAGSYRYG